MNKEEIWSKTRHFKVESNIGNLDLIDTDVYLDLLNKYDDLQHQLEEKDKVIDKVSKRLKLLGKYDGETCTRNFTMMSADFNELIEQLERGKNEIRSRNVC